MKRLEKIGSALAILGFLAALQSCNTASYAAEDTPDYSNPPWAPEYYPGARYYYLPDIETYYDLRDGDFVYLDNGQWYFVNSLPSMYSGYDLYNGYVITLDHNVYQPWMHHQYYVSHYPRYYYRSVHHNDGNSNPRGYNENGRPTVVKPRGQVPTPRPQVQGQQQPNGRVPVKSSASEKTPDAARQPQPSKYYGKEIGKPVKVTPQMKENKMREVPQPRTEAKEQKMPQSNPPKKGNGRQ